MNIKQFKDVLEKTAAMHARLGANKSASILRLVAHALKAADNTTVQRFVSDLKMSGTAARSRESAPIRFAEIRTVLEEIQAIYKVSGSDKPAKDLAEFISLLDYYEGQSIEELIAALSVLPASDKRATGKGATGKKSADAKMPDAQVVASFIERLANAGTNETQFEPVYAELGADKRVRTQEMDAIASGYIQGRAKWPSKTAAYQAIKKKFVERADKESRESIIGERSRWG